MAMSPPVLVMVIGAPAARFAVTAFSVRFGELSSTRVMPLALVSLPVNAPTVLVMEDKLAPAVELVVSSVPMMPPPDCEMLPAFAVKEILPVSERVEVHGDAGG